MTRQRVSSSSIRSVGYDAENRILEIELRGGGVYQYFQVPESEYKAFVKAASIGRHYAKTIKPAYEFRRVK
ncbi:MAG TPA: KTSC domain-containing protein [Pyrinomonadaceae bacterium]|nr:KTSC domain-containing protein [Pyrinomonadaceae bacterium]